MKFFATVLLTIILLNGNCQDGFNDSIPIPGRWSIEKINNWYKEQPWLVGCNYYPATSINQIEMWQESTWDPERIDLELGWASNIGMNTLRVYLHDLVWANDEQGLYNRMDEFLDICKKYKIRPWFVFFDDCHHPDPKLGEQPLPVKGYHNSGWVNCPSKDVSVRYASGKVSQAETQQLKGYIQKTLTYFKDDDRILAWELYNEPGRSQRKELSNKLVYDSWVWAREIAPSQPITSSTLGSIGARNIQINRINSDFHSIHCYRGGPSQLRKDILEYKKDDRPIIVSEWLARTRDSKVETCLPIMKELNAGAVNWGFVSGKSGTIWPWSSKSYEDGTPKDLKELREKGEVVESGETFPEPELWFHDLLRLDGTPYNDKEIETFKKLTGKTN